ncbi:glycosyltransferase [Vulcanisaeta souniana]|uniref:Glycosyltransferase 2-like domain-containing protein n=1 Tax=Vulcanisaeta souniana JCM 11219 TaxID=1293586 RepID=A0ABM8BKZ9_9CREN|nr:glycosyltransferase [Vulcanisaeta souniana]BDR91651.1 hypothetical protein Vsou_07440 [Vulcanisaeta souniana JCM 11219]
MSITLSMIVKNSVSRIGPNIFKKVLFSSLQVPYDTIILVDDGNDNTKLIVRDFASEHNKEILILRSPYEKPTRALARQMAINAFLENTVSEWLFFLDDDAILRPGWWEVSKELMKDPAVGEIWGINWDLDNRRKEYVELLGDSYKEYLIRAFQIRGGTHDTLYRRDAIRDVIIPHWLHVYEDAWLHHYVNCKGWKSAINEIGIIHLNSPISSGFMSDAQKTIIKYRLLLKYGIDTDEKVKIRIKNSQAVRLRYSISWYGIIYGTVRHMIYLLYGSIKQFLYALSKSKGLIDCNNILHE